MNFEGFLNRFPVAKGILDDIALLQKHLRRCIQIHQDLSPELYTPAQAGSRKMQQSKFYPNIRAYMNFLECEMQDVSYQQKLLCERAMRELISEYCESFKDDPSVIVDREVVNGYVQRAVYSRLSSNRETAPNNVKIRTSGYELSMKFYAIKELITKEEDLKQRKALQQKKFNCKQLILQGPFTSTAAVDAVISSQKTAVLTPGFKLGLLQSKLKQLRPAQHALKLATPPAGSENQNIAPASKKERRSKKLPLLTVREYFERNPQIKRPPPASPPQKRPTQEQFLMLFGLVPKEIADEARSNQDGKPKRMRRICVAKRKQDFYYGDYGDFAVNDNRR